MQNFQTIFFIKENIIIKLTHKHAIENVFKHIPNVKLEILRSGGKYFAYFMERFCNVK